MHLLTKLDEHVANFTSLLYKASCPCLDACLLSVNALSQKMLLSGRKERINACFY